MSVKTFSQLITENICSFPLNPSTASLHPLTQANSDAIQEGIRGPISGSLLFQGSWLPHCTAGSSQGCTGVPIPLPTWPQAGLGFQLSLKPRLKGPILQGAKRANPQSLVNGFVHTLQVKHFVNCFCLIRPDRGCSLWD